MDYYRRESSLGDLIGNWIEDRAIPTPDQVMDFLSQSFRDLGERPAPFEQGLQFDQCPREYTDEKALEFTAMTFRENYYLDVHCTVWTPAGFNDVFSRLAKLGVVNVTLSEPIPYPGRDEFIVHMTKLGGPKVERPQRPVPQAPPTSLIDRLRRLVR